MHDVKVRVLGHLSKLNMGYFGDNAPGKIKTALFDDIGRLENFMAHNTLELAQSFTVPVALFIALLFIHPVMAICMLIPIILGIVIPFRMIATYPDLTKDFAKYISELNASVNEYVHGMPIIKMYNLTAEKFKKYRSALSSYSKCYQEMSSVSCKPLAVTVVVLDGSVLFTLPIGGFLYLNGSLTMPAFLLFILLSLCFYSAFYNAINIMMGHMELESGLNSVREIMETAPVSGGSKELPKRGNYGIRFDDVSFSYGEGEALRHINLEIAPGTVTAFVGASGAGKTTAAQLIGRYWNTGSGTISIGGIPINELKTESLMDLTAFVFQDVFLLEDTLAENIRMGADFSEQQVMEAVKAAQIHDL